MTALLAVRPIATQAEREACARLMVGRLENYLVQGRAEILLRKTAGPWSEFHAGG